MARCTGFHFTLHVALIVALGAMAVPAIAEGHQCEADALARSRKLLRYHLEDGLPAGAIGDATSATAIAPVATLTGKGTFDVLEAFADVYKARYRMRFVYARLPGVCTLMGQEILEAGNPY